MQKRLLGDLEVSALGLGCMSMSFGYGAGDDELSSRTLHRALELGINFFDTASIYGLGHNEELIGRVLGSKRDAFVLASKCGIVVDDQGRRGVDGTPANIRATCEQSLKRLATDCIDLYYLHRRDFDVPIEDSAGAMADLVQEGKIRYIGLSEVSSSTLRRACAEARICAVQSEYSLWTRDPEHRVLEACLELGVGFVPFSPLGRGFFCGRIRSAEDFAADYDIRRGMPRFEGEGLQHNLTLLAAFEALATEAGCTPAQLALAWVLAQQDQRLVPIPGTRHVAYLEEDVQAIELQLDAQMLARAAEIFAPEHVSGERYAEDQKISLDPEE